MNRGLTLVLVTSIALIGCAGGPPSGGSGMAPAGVPTASREGPSTQTLADADDGPCRRCWIQVTPLSSVATDFTRYPDAEYSNAYTRLVISSRHTHANGSGLDRLPDSNVVNSYKYVDRGALPRLLWGTHYAMNLTASVSVGSFQATVPLMTIDHVSTRSDGEKYTRVVAHTAQNFPLFLLKGDGSNSIASVRFIVKSTDTVDSSAAAQAIQLADVLVKTVVPASPVLTTLSAQQTKDTAVALDKAIDQVLSKQLDEEQWVDNDIRRWKNGLSVTFKVPDANNEAEWGADDGRLKPVGVWSISFEDPRPSIFSDIQVCPPWNRPGELQAIPKSGERQRFQPRCPASLQAAAREAEEAALSRPEQVLGFPLVSGSQSLGTVAAYLKQSDFWADAMSTLAPAQPQTPKSDDLTRVCRRIKNAIAGIGLNAVDTGIVVAAVRDGMGLPDATIAAMKKTPACGLAVALN